MNHEDGYVKRTILLKVLGGKSGAGSAWEGKESWSAISFEVARC